ncbi:MAG TPA: ABC transporter ATP-binding protein [Pyrinomonadaceae bacterium]|nr:ABC transporter ATP-binding protein [Pyrinomonadaceae bacterium]
MGDALIQLVEVTKRFGNRTVVDRVSLNVTAGEVVALLGPSGSGKTTILRLIAGLEKPDSGEVWLAGKRVAANGQNLSPPGSRGIGFVFQDLALWPHLTVEGNLDFVLSCARMKRVDRKQRIEEVLTLVHALPFAKSYPAQLSGGEQQRAAIARAIVGKPQLLLLDEPMSSLDSDLKTSLLHELTALQKALKITSVYVTHNREEAAALAHRVISMNAGLVESNQIEKLSNGS